MVCSISSILYSSAASFFLNYLPLSDTISSGVPYLQIHLLKIASPVVSASLSVSATGSTYLVNASVMHRTIFLSLSDVFSGPKRSMCELFDFALCTGVKEITMLVEACHLCVLYIFDILKRVL